MAVRFAPTVHGMNDHGFIAIITEVARRTGVSAYVGDGSHAWAAGPMQPDWCGLGSCRRQRELACTRSRRTPSPAA
jgi:hypothetical protein